MLPLTKEELKSHEDAKLRYICGKRIFKRLSKSLTYWKVRGHRRYTGKYGDVAYNIGNLNFDEPNEISVVFHNSSNYDYHFIFKKLANESQGQFECLGGCKEKYKTFHFPIKKEIIIIDKYRKKSVDFTTYPTK